MVKMKKVVLMLAMVAFFPIAPVAGQEWVPITLDNVQPGISFSHPAFMKYTFPTRHDLFMGSGDGTLYHQASLETNGTYQRFAAFEAGLITLAFERGGPFVYDMNGDGRDDLLVGDASGKVHLLLQQNTGNFLINDSLVEGVEVSNFAKPTVGDLNGDSVPELIVGEGNGSLVVYFNKGTRDSPQWQADRTIFNFPLGRYPVPFAFHPDPNNPDSTVDLIVGTERFGIIYLKNFSDDEKFDFEVIQFSNGGNPFHSLNIGQRKFLAPTLVDFDGDGFYDLVSGMEQGGLIGFRNPGVDFTNIRKERGVFENPLNFILMIALVAMAGAVGVLYYRSRPERGLPLYLMLVHSTGIAPYSFEFGAVEVEDRTLAGGAFVGISSIISEITSGDLSSMDLGDKQILVTKVPFRKDPTSDLLVLLWSTADDPELRKKCKTLGEYVAENFEDVFVLGEITDEFKYKVDGRVEVLFAEHLEKEQK